MSGTQVHESIDREMVEQPKLKETVWHTEKGLCGPLLAFAYFFHLASLF